MGKAIRSSGFGIIEIVIAAAIIGTAIFSLFNVFVLANRLSGEAGDKISANFLAEEGLEAVRYLRDDGWTKNIAGLSAGTNYYLSFDKNTSRWSMGTVNPGTIDGTFTRVFTVENVSRDSSDNIVSSGGTNDPDTKKINVSITWSERGSTQTLTLSTYLTNFNNN